MRKAVGFVEIKSIPVGIQTADEMVKAGNVELLLSTPICPGIDLSKGGRRLDWTACNLGAGCGDAGRQSVRDCRDAGVYPDCFGGVYAAEGGCE